MREGGTRSRADSAPCRPPGAPCPLQGDPGAAPSRKWLGSLKMDAHKEVQTSGELKCELCDLPAPYTYCGWMPPNSQSIVHGEKVTFGEERRKCSKLHPLLLTLAEGHGALTLDIFDCSLFYSKSFCLPCVKENLKPFPLEIQDMDKRKPQQKSCKKNGYKA
uniref:Cysteine-rich DPF motif domain-containing protein 1 n=2 Tax=Cyanistes caeruleus TaxID=156563 RepID=A0A8C0U7A5_CYACU